MAFSNNSHLQTICKEWAAVRAAWTDGKAVSVTGGDLTIADVVAVALRGTSAQLSESRAVRARMTESVEFLASELAAGKVIYGVNTGFGGSADTRTQQFHRLQSALVQHLNVGILLPSDKGQAVPSVPTQGAANVDLLLRSHALPAAVVRATMLIRSNSLARGHSAVRIEVVESLLHLLSANVTPVVPLRGSISASGDLSPLSYVAGLLEGNPGVYARCEQRKDTGAATQYLSADNALHAMGLPPVQLQAKEGLGITNGTAPSAAAASLAVHMANQMAVWTQLLTAMGTEALAGTVGNYDAFISLSRPHQGQAEAASTILRFLQGSKLCPGHAAPSRVGLAQDRYALRTAPQWIGPQLEDLALATRQVTTELNATTDNPLIDVAGRAVHHGGNFQAMAVTSAMEKTMTALQNLGRLLYAQSSELVDNARNRGLPPNLSADDPSTSFLCKGFDVNMAAYQAELAYLARPVSGHVQVAEMTNQSVNSMALVAARYALEAGEVVGLMVATYLYVLCQALDLRCIQRAFREAATMGLREVVERIYDGPAPEGDHDGNDAVARVIAHTLDRWDELAHLDLEARSQTAVRDTIGTLLTEFTSTSTQPTTFPSTEQLIQYQKLAAECLAYVYDLIRTKFFLEAAPASFYLSPASRVVYDYVRLELQIPLHRGIDDHPTLVAEQKQKQATKGSGHVNGVANGVTNDTNGINGSNGVTNGNGVHVKDADAGSRGDRTRIIGTLASEIYVAVRDGRLFDRVVSFCEKAKPWAENQ
ncbi:hypothetical protein SBRCBS47491_007791 [Sporothrix bragantina]|uniref:Phenylalanine ammonia-lyase n=1 Tax=Sporothrix bragantina TaxID=671064 RepID=A0ABP0CGD4_9PEZI